MPRKKEIINLSDYIKVRGCTNKKCILSLVNLGQAIESNLGQLRFREEWRQAKCDEKEKIVCIKKMFDYYCKNINKYI